MSRLDPMRVCSSCDHWAAYDDVPNTGRCMRRPPIVLFDSEALTRDRFPSLWPETNFDDWCGEFVPGPGWMEPV